VSYCKAPYNDASVTTGWTCPPTLTSLIYQDDSWQCTDGTHYGSPSFSDLSSPLDPACFASSDWIVLGIMAAELALIDSPWNILLVMGTAVFYGLSELKL
jgi:hypothetical protein